MANIPDVTIFVRHKAGCPHAGDEFHKGCRCKKHLRWSSGGKQHRISAKTRSWSEAEEARRRIESAFQAGGKSSTAATQRAKTILLAIDSFIASKKSQAINAHVIKKYQRELGRLDAFMADRGKYFAADITLDELIEFRAAWGKQYPSVTTRQKVQERLRGFLRYLYDAGHIDRIPSLSPIRAKDSPTLPLSEKEYKSLLDAIPKAFTNPQKAARVRALIRLMRHSGLAIRDAVTLERSGIQYDERKKLHRIVTARQKTGTHVSVPLPPGVAKELLDVLNGNPRYVFWSGNGQEETAVKDWHHFLRELFRKAGLSSGHPNQLRNSFAVDLLAKGVPLAEVSKLLGHESIRTTERYYAKWVPERQERLDRLVVETWGEK
jgi:site-specific recombinase XerD